MANAGDLNMDGYMDLIIGAPLTDNSKGTVYIYYGTGSGPHDSFIQVRSHGNCSQIHKFCVSIETLPQRLRLM